MELALRGGLGNMTASQCRQSPSCTTFENLVCNGPGYFTDFCTAWRAGLDTPPSVKPPQIDTAPGSPTYGQAMVDGHAVASAADVAAVLDQQQIDQIAAWQAQNQEAFDSMTPYTTIPGIADAPTFSDAFANYIGPALIVLAGIFVIGMVNR